MRNLRLFLLAVLITTIAAVAYLGRTRTDESDNRLSATNEIDASPEPLVVLATANEFRWTFRLPGDDGSLNTEDDILSRDELHVPVGVHVELQLTSNDYIYIFNIPSLDVREAAVPGIIINVSFRSGTRGTHNIMTDPMCGVRYFHDDVTGYVIADNPIDFAGWMKAQMHARSASE